MERFSKMKGLSQRNTTWTHSTFQKMKKAITDAIVLTAPDYSRPFFCSSDASKISGSFCVYQLENILFNLGECKPNLHCS